MIIAIIVDYKEEQIPTKYNEEKTLRVIRKQNHIRGERKRSKTINDIPLNATLARALKDLEFPANKNEIADRGEFYKDISINH
jgi:hypothetical protein